MTDKEKTAAFNALQVQLEICDGAVDWALARIKELRESPYPTDLTEQVQRDRQVTQLMNKLKFEHRLHAKLAARYQLISRS